MRELFFKKRGIDINYAAMAFLEVEFTEAFSKLKTIREDEKLTYTWEKLATMEQRDLILIPIANAMTEFKERYENYNQVKMQTKLNELNSVLTQDFSEIDDVTASSSKVNSSHKTDFSDFLESNPLEIIETSIEKEEDHCS